MQLIRKYLKQLTDAELGVNKIIPLGDKLGDKAQEIIDSIQKAKSEKITFRMVEALELARMLKNALKNMPNLEYQEFKKKGING
jgi:metal-sulfur cluster biosynthetic enzyme